MVEQGGLMSLLPACQQQGQFGGEVGGGFMWQRQGGNCLRGGDSKEACMSHAARGWG